jgi:5'-3' exonuclease
MNLITFDLERVIADFVMFCMLIGNDFLAPLCAPDMALTSLENMIAFYKEKLPNFPSYLTDKNSVNWKLMVPFLAKVDRNHSLKKQAVIRYYKKFKININS